MREQTDRDAILRETAKKTVVYRLPGMDTLPPRRDITYESSRGSRLPMALYTPAATAADAPVVLMPLAFLDPECGARMYGPITSWARLFAASGITAVIYGTDAPNQDVHAALRHLRADGTALGIDATRVGLFATSGNVTVALSALMRDDNMRCAALLYGYTMDLDGSTTVATMSARYGFVDACAGRSVDALPETVPILLVRAGRDRFPGLNDALDRVIARALERNLPFTLVNHATGAHGFDVDEDSDVSRRIVEQVLAFLQCHLGMASR